MPGKDALYIHGSATEDRVKHMDGWRSGSPSLKFIQLEELGTDSVRLANGQTLSLRSKRQIHALLDDAAAPRLYLDVTGISNHVWPAFLKIALERGLQTDVVYVEPRNYSYSPDPRENVFFDLSERIIGIAPIPQFANLSEPAEEDVTLVALLGFEGARFAHLIEQIQPPGDNIYPVIGVPGFRAEYPFYSYQGNQISLRSSRSYRNVRYAKANCPFSLFYTLSDITGSHKAGQHFKVGLIGTKPHALGAVLFSLLNPSNIELVYDHTKKRPERTEGHSHCLLYPVTQFIGYVGGLP